MTMDRTASQEDCSTPRARPGPHPTPMRRSRSLSELPGSLRVPIIQRCGGERMRARLEAGRAGIEELKMLREQQQKIVDEAMSSGSTRRGSSNRPTQGHIRRVSSSMRSSSSSLARICEEGHLDTQDSPNDSAFQDDNLRDCTNLAVDRFWDRRQTQELQQRSRSRRPLSLTDSDFLEDHLTKTPESPMLRKSYSWNSIISQKSPSRESLTENFYSGYYLGENDLCRKEQEGPQYIQTNGKYLDDFSIGSKEKRNSYHQDPQRGGDFSTGYPRYNGNLKPYFGSSGNLHSYTDSNGHSRLYRHGSTPQLQNRESGPQNSSTRSELILGKEGQLKRLGRSHSFCVGPGATGFGGGGGGAAGIGMPATYVGRPAKTQTELERLYNDENMEPRLRRASLQCDAVLTRAVFPAKPLGIFKEAVDLKCDFPSPLHAVLRQYGGLNSSLETQGKPSAQTSSTNKNKDSDTEPMKTSPENKKVYNSEHCSTQTSTPKFGAEPGMFHSSTPGSVSSSFETNSTDAAKIQGEEETINSSTDAQTQGWRCEDNAVTPAAEHPQEAAMSDQSISDTDFHCADIKSDFGQSEIDTNQCSVPTAGNVEEKLPRAAHHEPKLEYRYQTPTTSKPARQEFRSYQPSRYTHSECVPSTPKKKFSITSDEGYVTSSPESPKGRNSHRSSFLSDSSSFSTDLEDTASTCDSSPQPLTLANSHDLSSHHDGDVSSFRNKTAEDDASQSDREAHGFDLSSEGRCVQRDSDDFEDKTTLPFRQTSV